MKNLEIGKNYIVDLGRKFNHTKVLATFIETHDANKNTLVIKPLKIVDGTKMNQMLYVALTCQLIVDNAQILA